MRTPIIAGNWKMNGTLAQARPLVAGLLERLGGRPADGGGQPVVVVCPPFTALDAVGKMLAGTPVALGAQDMFWKDKGAYTGQIAPPMLVELGCEYVIVGHSEPRGRFGVPEPDFDKEILAYFGDTDAAINRKLLAAFSHGLTPILCVGETLSERQAHDTDSVVSGQLLLCLKGLSTHQSSGLVVAYEPVWAIGTGEVCPPDEADRVCGVIRAAVGRLYGPVAAEAVRILYGGSVKPANARELLLQSNIDGALVGGASLSPEDFAAIAAAAGPA
jgi:triosephosphate isomerase